MKKSSVAIFFFFFFASPFFFLAKRREEEREGGGGERDNGQWSQFFFIRCEICQSYERWVDDFVIKLSPVEIK